MSEHGYKFYMQECTKDGVLLGTQRDLEKDFDGLKYSKCEGLLDIGKPRIYTESYADSDKLRAYIPDEITNEATKVKFTFYILGENRQQTYDEFVEYVRGGYRVYHDTARYKQFMFIVTDEIKPANEMWYGGTPYLELNLTVQNLNGKTKNV